MTLLPGNSEFRSVDGQLVEIHNYRGAEIQLRPNQYLTRYCDAYVNGLRIGAMERKEALCKVCRLIDQVSGSKKS